MGFTPFALRGANPERADLEGARVTSGQLVQAEAFEQVTLPDG